MRILKIIFFHVAAITLGVFTFCASYAAYHEAGEHLTPATVHVSGYYRDGYYVHDYYRRPPGGAIHDAPYESRRSACMLIMFLGIGLVVVPLATFKPCLKVCLQRTRQMKVQPTSLQPTRANARMADGRR